MTTYAGAVNVSAEKAAKLKYGTLSGTVSKDAAGVARRVLVYKVGFPGIIANETVSNASTGAFSLSVIAGTNDCFRVVCIGIDGENSEIFENVSAG